MALHGISGATLNPKQGKAIAALLSEKTVGGAAQKAGVGERTLLRWLQTDDFKAAYRDARREATSQAIARLATTSSGAVDTLQSVCNDLAAPPAARVSAAKTLLDFAFRAVEIDDLAARVELLENSLELLAITDDDDESEGDE